MATNSQISDSLGRRKRSGGKVWLIVLTAILLVSVPVLPLKFLGIPGPDFSNVTDIGKAVIRKIQGTIPPPSNQKGALPIIASSEHHIGSTDVQLLDKTAQTLLRRVSDSPNDPSLHNRLGLTFLELGENHAAVTHFEQAVKISKVKISKLRAKANAAREKKNLIAAAEYITEISALDVQLAAAHSSLARVYERLGKSEKVIFHLNELDRDVKLSKSFTPSKSKTGQKKAKQKIANGARLNATTASILARANALKEAGRLQDSIQEYRRLVSLAPRLAMGHLQLGITAMSAHDLWLAESEIKEALNLAPENATAHSALGNVYMKSGRIEEAKKSYKKAIAIDPKVEAAAFNLGNIYASKGKYSEAREAFKKATIAEPNSAYAHNNLATMCSLEEDYPTAVTEFKAAIRFAPTMASAHYGLGLALMKLNRYRESIAPFRQALALNPSLVDAHNKIELAQKKSRTY